MESSTNSPEHAAVISCPSCQCPQINSQLTCRRCGEYLSTQGPVEHPTNAFTAVLVLALVIGGIGYGTYYFLQNQKAPAAKTTMDASATAAVTKVEAPKNVKTKKKKRRKH